MSEPTKQDIVQKADEYVTHCLGCPKDAPLLIATTEPER